jgi:hypothetical protein
MTYGELQLSDRARFQHTESEPVIWSACKGFLGSGHPCKVNRYFRVGSSVELERIRVDSSVGVDVIGTQTAVQKIVVTDLNYWLITRRQ